jgi:DNA polymerase III alpha subunit
LLAQKQIFIEAAKKMEHPEVLAKHIFEDVIEPFAGY